MKTVSRVGFRRGRLRYLTSEHKNARSAEPDGETTPPARLSSLGKFERIFHTKSKQNKDKLV